ncbi:MAG: DUF433 domain-containing protein [Pseudomonadota bacterium]
MTHERISQDPAVMVGKPVIKGTRITVEHILRGCSLGLSPDEIAEHYPSVTADDVKAALAYAADLVRGKTPFAAE